MKKTYMAPAAEVQKFQITSNVLAGSERDQYSSTYGNTGQQGGQNTDGITGTGTTDDSEYTQGSKQHNIWED